MTKTEIQCELPFWKDPSILFQHFSLQYKPSCDHSTWNFIVRLLLLSFFVGLIATTFGGLSLLAVSLLFGMITAVTIVLTTNPSFVKWDTYHKLPYIARVNPKPPTLKEQPIPYVAPVKESFINGGQSLGSIQPNSSPLGVEEIDGFPYSGPALPEYTPPTSRNPFMNILLSEIKYNPERAAAAPVDEPTVKQTFDDYFRIQWFSDPTDVFGKNQSQRQFVTQPSTTVPNDQGSFANWLYKIPGKTCKEGGRDACISGTDGSPVAWINIDS